MKIFSLNSTSLRDPNFLGLAAIGCGLLKTPHTFEEIVLEITRDKSQSLMRIAFRDKAIVAAAFFESADLPDCYLVHIGFTLAFYRHATQYDVYKMFIPPSDYRICVGWVLPNQAGLLRFLKRIGFTPTNRRVHANPEIIEFELTDTRIQWASAQLVATRPTFPSRVCAP